MGTACGKHEDPKAEVNLLLEYFPGSVWHQKAWPPNSNFFNLLILARAGANSEEGVGGIKLLEAVSTYALDLAALKPLGPQRHLQIFPPLRINCERSLLEGAAGSGQKAGKIALEIGGRQETM